MTAKPVTFWTCPCGSKRAYEDAHAAVKALGKAQAKRARIADRRGTGRGIRQESRAYECEYGMYHLTAQSRTSYLGAAA
ncbi:hypothetical protein ACIOGZ_08295 [Kitasatospora sp. NPDC088160]|uniref:hypothetical protein n=1 Tax=Kitasatospora sp. NPDC088160 TaxID=3364072 RepID=UPI00382F7B79